MISIHNEQIEADLAKCSKKLGFRPMWVIASASNKKSKQVRIKQVDSLPVFMGC